MSQRKHALIVGASKGIGLAVVQRLLQEGWTVVATYRSTAVSFQHPQLRWLKLDITDAAERAALIAQLGEETFGAVVINAGIYGPQVQAIAQADDNALTELFLTNAVAPVRMAEALLPRVQAQYGVVGITTSQLASLSENPRAEIPLYAASKAALNMLSRALSTTCDDPKMALLSLHPGWVKTDMGGENAAITPDVSAAGLVAQLQRFSGQGGHHYVDYRGEMLSW